MAEGTGFVRELAERRRFGMKPGLDTIREICRRLGDPQRRFGAVHVAGTNGKGAVCAIVDAALRRAGIGLVARYTSPHLVKLNERFFIDGRPIADEVLERAAESVSRCLASPRHSGGAEVSPTFFEALTAAAFVAFAEQGVKLAVLECGLGGRLDATNICEPQLCVITRIGLDHCDWLGDTVEKIAAEKAGIIKSGVPVVLGRNDEPVVEVVRRAAAERGAPFHYAPELVEPDEVPSDFPLPGSFNRENAVTALAALKVLACGNPSLAGLSVVWPGRFQRVGRVIVDGAHNPPAARALVEALRGEADIPRTLVFGACGDKDALEVLKILKPVAKDGLAVPIANPRGLSPAAAAALMRQAGIAARPCASLDEAISSLGMAPALICGSLFLAGEALVKLGAYPWSGGIDCPSELLRH